MGEGVHPVCRLAQGRKGLIERYAERGRENLPSAARRRVVFCADASVCVLLRSRDFGRRPYVVRDAFRSGRSAGRAVTRRNSRKNYLYDGPRRFGSTGVVPAAGCGGRLVAGEGSVLRDLPWTGRQGRACGRYRYRRHHARHADTAVAGLSAVVQGARSLYGRHSRSRHHARRRLVRTPARRLDASLGALAVGAAGSPGVPEAPRTPINA